MDSTIRRLAGFGAVLAPTLHVASDLIELAQDGYSDPQLWLNYAAFVLIPAVILALYVVQRPAISSIGLIGALIYGAAFVFFAYTTLYALSEHAPNYSDLWHKIGFIYTFHGILMLFGGSLFGIATIRAGVFPTWMTRLFLTGLAMNLAIAAFPVPEIAQVFGSTVRNAGLIGMGWTCLRDPSFE